MLSCLHLEGVAYRFQVFVEELRFFLKGNDVAYGFPEHLLAFTEKISTPNPLRAGVSAKLLEVIRASQQPVSHGELVELLLVTIGGATIDEDTPTVQKAERVLSQLVGEVMTSHEGVLSLVQHPAPEAPVAYHAEDLERTNLFAPDTAEPEVAHRAQQPGPQAIAWAAPPNFVWAAMLCGVLLPPCMYLLSRPHEARPSPPQATSTSSMHPGARPTVVPGPVVLPVYEPKPLDLDFGDAPAPKKRSHTPTSQPVALNTSQARPAEVVSVAGPGSKTPSGTDANTSSRQTDMPGRDLAPPEPVSTPQKP